MCTPFGATAQRLPIENAPRETTIYSGKLRISNTFNLHPKQTNLCDVLDMALLSLSVSQLLLAFASASILHKLTFNRFFLKWLASHQFVCFLIPTNTDLKKISSKQTKDGQSSKKANSKSKSRPASDPKEIFKIPSSCLDSLKLDKTIITVRDLELINFSLDLEWIVDLAVMSLFSFTITQTQFYFFPQSTECNFSLLWTLLVNLYCVRTLWKLTAIYFKNQDSIAERSICIISGGIFLLIAMLILLVDENQLELGIESAYRLFNDSATKFVKSHSIRNDISRQHSKPMSFIVFKFCIAVLSSLIGMLYTFPGLRFGQLHKNLLDRDVTSNLQIMAYNLNYLMPLFVVCLWIKPLSRAFITSQEFILIDDTTFDVLRIYCVILINLFRFYLLPNYVAIFLQTADRRIMKLKQRGGSTTNREIQLTVSSIFNYVNVVAIQYILPILMCLFTVIMFKTLGGYSWIPTFTDGSMEFANGTIPVVNATGPFLELANGDIGPKNISDPAINESTIVKSIEASTFAAMVDLDEMRKIFTPKVFKGILGFATWWFHFSWFCSSTAGLIYHTYFIT